MKLTQKGQTMNTTSRYIVLLSLAFLLFDIGNGYTVLADHDDHHDRNRKEKWKKRHSEQGEADVEVLTNTIYAETCGACHFPYHAGLLPQGSWDKILNRLSDHFGQVVEIDPESSKTIAEYLTAHAADHCYGELSREIMKSLDGQTPLRITQVPCIQEEHHEIPSSVFEAKAIGSFSNCIACHATAERGIYDDDAVAIPK